MPKTAEQILKAQGLSDADITAMSTLLSNQTYRAAIENTVNKLESDVATWQQRDAEWQASIDTQYTPAVTRAEQDAQKARLEAAQLREQIEIAKTYGYLDDPAAKEKLEAQQREQQQRQNHGQPGKINLNDPEFVSFTQNFASREGDAMARYNFVSEEYRLLNGGTINDYVSEDGKRGMVALRAEALAAKKDIDVYAAEKFNWSGKRAEQAAKRQADHDAEIARKAVEKYALEHGSNPMTSAPNPSRMPMMPTKVNDGKPVQPWERPMATAERRQRAYETETRARVN